jgi:hypothetical protein
VLRQVSQTGGRVARPPPPAGALKPGAAEAFKNVRILPFTCAPTRQCLLEFRMKYYLFQRFNLLNFFSF